MSGVSFGGASRLRETEFQCAEDSRGCMYRGALGKPGRLLFFIRAVSTFCFPTAS